MSINLLAATVVTPKVLCSTQLSDTSDHAVYTVPSTSAAIIKHGVLCNTGATPVTITKVSIIPSGGGVDGTHQVIAGYSLAANDSLSLGDYLVGACLKDGDAVHVQVSVGAQVDVLITGIEVF